MKKQKRIIGKNKRLKKTNKLITINYKNVSNQRPFQIDINKLIITFFIQNNHFLFNLFKISIQSTNDVIMYFKSFFHE